MPRTWYRFKIVYSEINLQVWMQTDKLRNVEMLLNVTDESLQRGTVGVSTNGNNGVYFDGLETKAYDPVFFLNNNFKKEYIFIKLFY